MAELTIEDAYYQCKCCGEKWELRDKPAFNEHRNQQLEKLASLRAKIEDVETLAKFLYDELNPFKHDAEQLSANSAAGGARGIS